MKVRLEQVVFNAGTQVRAGLDQQIVADYAEAMTNGVIFPSIVLFHDGNHHYLADGFHRFMAAQRLSFVDIDADVHPGSKDDALWFALGANREHAKSGLRLSHADKRHAAILVIQRWPDRSAGAIADQLGVHQTFVSDMKRQHDLKSALPVDVIGRDGKVYPASGSSRISTEKTAEVIAALKSGRGVSQVATATRMSTRTVQKIREAAGIPLRLDKTREGIEQRRGQMREMAEQGYSTRQIAAAVRTSEETTRNALRALGVSVPADKVIGRSKRHDANRIVEQIVADAENLTEGVNLVDFSALDRTQIAGWLGSLQASRDKFGAFIRRLMKEQQHGQVA